MPSAEHDKLIVSRAPLQRKTPEKSTRNREHDRSEALRNLQRIAGNRGLTQLLIQRQPDAAAAAERGAKSRGGAPRVAVQRDPTEEIVKSFSTGMGGAFKSVKKSTTKAVSSVGSAVTGTGEALKRGYTGTTAPAPQAKPGEPEPLQPSGDQWARIGALVEEKKQKVEKGGMTPQQAELAVYGRQENADLKPFLLPVTEFDLMRREIDRLRLEEAAERASEVGDKVRELNKLWPRGNPFKIKEIEKQLEKDFQDERAFEKKALEEKAYKLLSFKKAIADSKVQSAPAGSDDKKAAQKERDELNQLDVNELVKKLQEKLEEDIAEKLQKKTDEIQAKTFEKPEDRDEALRAVAVKVRKEARNDLIKKPGKALQVVEGISSGLKPVVKSPLAGPAASGAGVLDPIAGAAARAVTTALRAFVGGVDVFKKYRALQGGQYDKDTEAEMKAEVVAIIADITKNASRIMDLFSGPQGALASASGVAPAIGIVGNMLGIAAALMAITFPMKRLMATSEAMANTNDEVLRTALKRTRFENELQASSEVVSIAADFVILLSNIAEVASGGGMGAPMALKLAATCTKLVWMVRNAVYSDIKAQKTQKARQAAIGQGEGTAEKLIKTDVTYAADTLIVRAKQELTKTDAHTPGSPEHGKAKGEEHATKVLESYGLDRQEIRRLTFQEVRAKVLEKLDTDEEQLTMKQKIVEGVEGIAEALGPDKKLKEFRPLEQDIKDPVKEKTLKEKVAKKFEGVGEHGKKTKLLTKKQNEFGLKGKRDRGSYEEFKLWIKSDEAVYKQEEKLRKQIIARVTDEAEQNKLLDALMTEKERESKEKEEAVLATYATAAAEKANERVVTPGFMPTVRAMSDEELRKLLADPAGLSPADLAYAKYDLSVREGKEGPATYGIKHAWKPKGPSRTERAGAWVAGGATSLLEGAGSATRRGVEEARATPGRIKSAGTWTKDFAVTHGTEAKESAVKHGTQAWDTAVKHVTEAKESAVMHGTEAKAAAAKRISKGVDQTAEAATAAKGALIEKVDAINKEADKRYRQLGKQVSAAVEDAEQKAAALVGK